MHFLAVLIVFTFAALACTKAGFADDQKDIDSWGPRFANMEPTAFGDPDPDDPAVAAAKLLQDIEPAAGDSAKTAVEELGIGSDLGAPLPREEDDASGFARTVY